MGLCLLNTRGAGVTCVCVRASGGGDRLKTKKKKKTMEAVNTH